MLYQMTSYSLIQQPYINEKVLIMNIYVGNVPREITEEVLRQTFEAFGKVDKITLIKDRFSGEPRGFGFVEMPINTEAEAAIAGLNSKELQGKALVVNEARPRTDRRGRRGGGRRGNGGRERRGGGNRSQ
jgi:RNA recognition motif-containing protein